MKESIIDIQNLRNAWKTVRAKDSAGGIDGVSLKEYGLNVGRNLKRLHEMLSEGRWRPSPYVDFHIPKADGSERSIGLLVVEDKIVQTAIKNVIEPIMERTFSSSSYAYRPGRGHLKCVRRVTSETSSKANGWFFRADIDDYFDSIDREILIRRLRTVIKDDWVLEMIDLCMSMGRIDSKGRWSESKSGLPQGAVLSPMLANFYLNSFDQSVTSRTSSYVRYSDDFVIWGDSDSEVRVLAEAAVNYLQERMNLSLNMPFEIGQTDVGFDFLGLHFCSSGVSVTSSKLEELAGMVEDVKFEDGQLSKSYIKCVEGIRRYYLSALPSSYRDIFREMMDDVCMRWEDAGVAISKKTVTQIRHYVLGDDSDIRINPADRMNSVNKLKAIRSRKLEYRRMEAENAELVISGAGYFLGSSGTGLVLRKNGQPIKIRSSAVRHITVIGSGVGVSSNVISFCRDKGIAMDYFSADGNHLASLLSPSHMSMSLWTKQTELGEVAKSETARKIILFKLRNQRNLCCSINKYHRNKDGEIEFTSFLERMDVLVGKVKAIEHGDSFISTLMAYEAQAAVEYWEYVREILQDSDVEFHSRVKQGAKDIVNSMLNYGYSLLYPRIWQAILRHGLNPYAGLIHHTEGNANLVFDLIELFRCQAVDRVVISMINKGERCAVDKDGKLCDETKTSLTRHVMERLNRYEIYRGESRTLNDIIDMQVLDFSRFISGGSAFRPYVAKW